MSYPSFRVQRKDMDGVEVQNLLVLDIMENRNIPCGSSSGFLISNSSEDFNSDLGKKIYFLFSTSQEREVLCQVPFMLLSAGAFISKEHHHLEPYILSKPGFLYTERVIR